MMNKIYEDNIYYIGVDPGTAGEVMSVFFKTFSIDLKGNQVEGPLHLMDKFGMYEDTYDLIEHFVTEMYKLHKDKEGD